MGNFSFKNHIFCHISGTTGLIGLKFLVRADFGHPVAHTKLQPLSLKDAEDIGWCVRNARGARRFHRTVFSNGKRLLAAVTVSCVKRKELSTDDLK